MDDKKAYKAVLKTLDLTSTVATVLNRLSDVRIETEDEQLQRMIDFISAQLRTVAGKPTEKVRLLGLPQHYQTLVAAVKQTQSYRNACINVAEKQWEILARRAGWTPPATA